MKTILINSKTKHSIKSEGKSWNPLKRKYGKHAFNTRGKTLTIKFQHPEGRGLGISGVWRYFR